jgi:dCMP deaminase
MKRNKHKLYMGIAQAVAKFGTCGRAQVGAILVKDGRVMGTGYNGAPAGEAHCADVGCLLIRRWGKDHCATAIHAEVNAILNARSDVRGATLYCTHEPCYDCMRLLINAGISRIIYKREYPGSKKTPLLKNSILKEKL